MHAIRRMAGAAVAAGVVAAFVGVSPARAAAPAAQPEVYLGSASATALALNLAGQTLTVGSGAAKLTSNLLASASGVAVNGLLGQTTSQAQVSGRPDGAQNDGPKCMPSLSLDVLTLKNACTTSSSALSGGLAFALSHNTVDSLQLTLNSALSSIPLGQTLTDVLQPIVNQLPAPLQTTLKPATDTVGNVLTDVLQTPTAQLVLGDSDSGVQSSKTQVESGAIAKGGQLDILPASQLIKGTAVQPLASVIIGSSTATASYNRTTGKSVANFDPALVKVVLAATPLSPAATIPVTVGQTQTISLPAGLGSLTIQVADGKTFTNPDGSVGAEANAVKVALTLLSQPVINLSVAGAQAVVAGAPAVVAAPQSPAAPAALPPKVVRSLPHTGGTPWVPFAGALVLAGFLFTRRVIAAAR